MGLLTPGIGWWCMDFFVKPWSATVGGVAFPVLSVVLAGILMLTTPFTGCTDVGVPNDVNTGFEFIGVENANILYSPDGANVCQSPLQVIVIPLVPGIGGLLLLAYSRYSNDQPAAGMNATDQT